MFYFKNKEYKTEIRQFIVFFWQYISNQINYEDTLKNFYPYNKLL